MDNIKILIKEYVSPEVNLISNLANISSILYNQLEDVNWLGFYLANNELEELYLGPFQGLQAVTNISYQAGVCGSCAVTRKMIVVDDVHAFSGHIACDFRSKSEIVVPIFDKEGNLFAVLDVDSPIKSRFSIAEQELFAEIAKDITNLI